MGGFSLNKKFYTKIPVQVGLSDQYIFLGGSNNTIGTLLNANELIGNNTATSADQIHIYDVPGSPTIYFLRGDGITWRKVGTTQTANNILIPNGTIIAFFMRSSKVLTTQGTNLIQKNSNLGNTSIKKQNFNSIIVAGTSPAYIFAGGSAGNTLDTFFDKNQFTQGTSPANSDVVQTVDQFGIGRSFFIRSSDSTWRRNGSGSNHGNVPINIGQAITFITLNNAQKTFTMIGNNLLQKLNSGRLSLNKK